MLAEVTYRRYRVEVSAGAGKAPAAMSLPSMRADEERAEAERQPSWILACARRRAEAAAVPARRAIGDAAGALSERLFETSEKA